MAPSPPKGEGVAKKENPTSWSVDFHGLEGLDDGTYVFLPGKAKKGSAEGITGPPSEFQPTEEMKDLFAASALLEKWCSCRK